MKKLSLIAMLTLLMTMLSFQSFAQDEVKSQTVIIRMGELMNSFSGSLSVIQPDGSIVSQELNKLNLKSLDVGLQNNSSMLHTEIDKWKQKGFVISGISASSTSVLVLTTVILSK